jgi:hypothetical protein
MYALLVSTWITFIFGISLFRYSVFNNCLCFRSNVVRVSDIWESVCNAFVSIVTFSYTWYVWEIIVIKKNIVSRFLTDLHVFSPPDYENVVFLCNLSVCLSTCMDGYVRFTSAWNVDGFYSHSTSPCLSVIGRCLRNVNILVEIQEPIRWAQNTKWLFSPEQHQLFWLNFTNFCTLHPCIKLHRPDLQAYNHTYTRGPKHEVLILLVGRISLLCSVQ